MQPFFLVPPDSPVESMTHYKKIPGCYVIWHIIGMDEKGRFLLDTHRYENVSAECIVESKQKDYCDDMSAEGRR